MTIQEAIKSEKPITRLSWGYLRHYYLWNKHGQYLTDLNGLGAKMLHKEDKIATDWEIKPESEEKK